MSVVYSTPIADDRISIASSTRPDSRLSKRSGSGSGSVILVHKTSGDEDRIEVIEEVDEEDLESSIQDLI